MSKDHLIKPTFLVGELDNVIHPVNGLYDFRLFFFSIG
jgi:hypothetical protein